MISPLGSSKLLKEEEKLFPNKRGPDSSNVSLSEIYAQEIEENLMNENKEAILRKNALESGTYENAVKNKLNMETGNLILSENENPLVLRPKAVPKNAFSYIQNCDFVRQPKPPLFPKPKDRSRITFSEKAENDKQAQDMESDIKIGAIPVNKVMSCLTFDSKLSSDKQRSGDHDSSKNKTFRSEDSKLEEPPPLPTRPPPVFKYPLGTFYKETADLNEARKKKEERKSLQNECHLSERLDRFMIINDEITEINERSFNLETSMIREIIPTGTPLEIRNVEPVKTLPVLELELKINKDKDRSFPPVIKSSIVQKRSLSTSIGAERLQKMLPSEELEFYVQARKNSLLKAKPADFQKSTISVPLGKQEKKPPQPVPRPELNVIKDNKKYFPSENVSGIFPKKLISTPLEKRKSQKPLSVSDIELKKNIGLTQKSKSIDSEVMGLEKMKPKVPCKPNNLFHQRLEQILIEQRIREQECINPMSTLKPSIENLAEFSENDWMDLRKSTIPKIISTTTKMSLDSSIGFKTDGFLSKSVNSLSGKLESISMDSSSQDLEDEQGKIDFSQDSVEDFSVFHSLNRPTLPQKMKSTQRSLSYTSLVQTVKDIGATIWNPYDKSKRSSTGMIPKTTDEGRNETEQTDTKFLEVKRSHEEEKAEIVRSIWFHDISATEAQQRLLKLDQDGAFLIRPTSRPTDNIQYTASITYGKRVFNIHIRRKENYHFALGKEKEGEKSFQKLSDLIKYYQDVPFDIHPTGSSDPHAICFRVTPPH